jgi:hypothetical protein
VALEMRNAYAYPEAREAMSDIAKELRKANEDKSKLAAKLAWDKA